jgi:hypothetical protein
MKQWSSQGTKKLNLARYNHVTGNLSNRNAPDCWEQTGKGVIMERANWKEVVGMIVLAIMTIVASVGLVCCSYDAATLSDYPHWVTYALRIPGFVGCLVTPAVLNGYLKEVRDV